MGTVAFLASPFGRDGIACDDGEGKPSVSEPLQCSYELSSMGIRVSPESMDRQLTAAGCDDRRKLPFHKAVLNGELPYTIGGGIGQSRLCMLLLGSAHIGEVQASVWDNATREACEKAGIPLL